ncbi:ABC transporter substrate-binding protein [Treponema parvum]|nr:ABC transporter substrate-binding protein [Treponema parvum]
MMKKILLLAITLFIALDFAGFSASENKNGGAKTTIRVGIPKAPPALPILRMIDSQAMGKDVDINFTIWDAPEKLIAMVQSSDFDMFAFPLTVVAKLYNRGVPVTLTNVNTWGVTYFMTTDPNFKNWSDLKNKTVYVPLQSSPPDVITQFFMKKAGLTPKKDVTIIYASIAEVGQMMAAGKAQYITMIEPQVTSVLMQNKNARVAFSFEDEWKKFTDNNTIIPNAGFGAKTKFVKENPELTKRFEQEYEKALNWVLANPDKAASLAEEKLGLKAPVVQKAIPRMGLMYKNAYDAKADLKQFWQLLVDFDPTTIGGKVPDETLLYKK